MYHWNRLEQTRPGPGSGSSRQDICSSAHAYLPYPSAGDTARKLVS